MSGRRVHFAAPAATLAAVVLAEHNNNLQLRWLDAEGREEGAFESGGALLQVEPADVATYMETHIQYKQIVQRELDNRYPGAPAGVKAQFWSRIVNDILPKKGSISSTSVSLQRTNAADCVRRAIGASLRHQLNDQFGILYPTQHLMPKLEELGIKDRMTLPDTIAILAPHGIGIDVLFSVESKDTSLDEVATQVASSLEARPTKYEVILGRGPLSKELPNILHVVVWCGVIPAAGTGKYEELWLLRDSLFGTVAAVPRSEIIPVVKFIAKLTIPEPEKVVSLFGNPPPCLRGREVILAAGAPSWYTKQEACVEVDKIDTAPEELSLVDPLTVLAASAAADGASSEVWTVRSLVRYEDPGHGLRGHIVKDANDGEWLAVLAGPDRKRACCTLAALKAAGIVSDEEERQLNEALPLEHPPAQ